MITPQRTVVVAGASAGLGAALTLLHAKRGERVVAIARRQDRLDALACRSGAVTPLVLDITRPRAPDMLVDALLGPGSVGRFYAVAAAPPPERPDLDALQAYMHLIYSTWPWWFRCLSQAGLLDASSTFVVVSSLAASIPFPGLDYYSAGKAALESWARSARAGFDGRLAIVRPGQFESEFHHGPRPLDLDALPHQQAQQTVRLLDKGRDDVILGGWRDVVASRLSSLVAPNRLRRALFGL